MKERTDIGNVDTQLDHTSRSSHTAQHQTIRIFSLVFLHLIPSQHDPCIILTI